MQILCTMGSGATCVVYVLCAVQCAELENNQCIFSIVVVVVGLLVFDYLDSGDDSMQPNNETHSLSAFIQSSVICLCHISMCACMFRTHMQIQKTLFVSTERLIWSVRHDNRRLFRIRHHSTQSI